MQKQTISRTLKAEFSKAEISEYIRACEQGRWDLANITDGGKLLDKTQELKITNGRLLRAILEKNLLPALMICLSSDNPEDIKLYEDLLPCFTFKNWLRNAKELRTPLHLAVMKGRSIIVGDILEIGHSLNVFDEEGNTPLHLACKFGYLEVAIQLLKSNAVPWQNLEGKLPDEIIKQEQKTKFEESGFFDLYEEAKKEKNALNSIALKEAYEMKEGLFLAEALLNKDYELALRRAISGQLSIATCQEILDHVTNINSRSLSNGWAAMHYAAAGGKVDLVSLCINKGAYLNMVDYEGNSSLHVAADKYCREFKLEYLTIIVELLTQGALIFKNFKDKSPHSLLPRPTKIPSEHKETYNKYLLLLGQSSASRSKLPKPKKSLNWLLENYCSTAEGFTMCLTIENCRDRVHEFLDSINSSYLSCAQLKELAQTSNIDSRLFSILSSAMATDPQIYFYETSSDDLHLFATWFIRIEQVENFLNCRFSLKLDWDKQGWYIESRDTSLFTALKNEETESRMSLSYDVFEKLKGVMNFVNVQTTLEGKKILRIDTINLENVSMYIFPFLEKKQKDTTEPEKDTLGFSFSR